MIAEKALLKMIKEEGRLGAIVAIERLESQGFDDIEVRRAMWSLLCERRLVLTEDWTLTTCELTGP